MDAVVMCGGHGRRLQTDAEKPLFEIGGRPMVERVLDALEESEVEAVYAAPSPNAPDTRAYLESQPVNCIDTPGEGYVEDLQYVLDKCETPVLTVVADLPLLDSSAVNLVLNRYDTGSLGMYVPAGLKQVLDVSHDLTTERDGRELAPTGINIVGDGEESVHVTYDIRLAVNVNRREDARVAEEVL